MRKKKADSYHERLSKFIVLNCIRNHTSFEDLHAGIAPSSKTGDFSDVKVVSPFGEIPWTELSRFNDAEVKILMKEIVNNVFTFLKGLSDTGSIPQGLFAFQYPEEWDSAEIAEDIGDIFDMSVRAEKVGVHQAMREKGARTKKRKNQIYDLLTELEEKPEKKD